MNSRQSRSNLAVDLTFASTLRGGLRRRCLCVCILLTICSYTAALGCRLADAVMHGPCGSGITAVEVVAVTLRVTAGCHRLLACRGDCPTAAVDVGGDAIQNRGNVDTSAVHLFQRFQLDFVRVDSIREIQRFSTRIAGAPRFVHRLTFRGQFRDFIVISQCDGGIVQNDKALPCGVAGDVQCSDVYRFGGVVGISRGTVHNFRGKAVRELLCLPCKAVKIGAVVWCVLRRIGRNRRRCAAVEALRP